MQEGKQKYKINETQVFEEGSKTVFICKLQDYIENPVGFPAGSDGKESVCNAGDPGMIPGWRRSPGGGHGNPLQYSCLENSMHKGAWWATVHGVSKSQM